MPPVKRKPKHGGPRAGSGRPVTTGSESTRTVQFRVTAEQRDELEQEARRLGLSSGDLAAKRRAFPSEKKET